jgi:hypothetical protein
MEVSGQLEAPAGLLLGKDSPAPMNRRLDGPQSRSGSYGDENLLPLLGTEQRFLCCQALSLVTVPTTLSRLFVCVCVFVCV